MALQIARATRYSESRRPSVKERAVDLRRRRCSPRCRLRSALAPAALMDRLHQRVDFGWRQQALPSIVAARGVHVRDADAVVRVEDGDGVPRTNLEPMLQATAARIQRAGPAAAGRSHAVSPVSHVELILVVAVNFDQHLHVERVRLCGEPGDERRRLGIMKQLVPAFLMAKPTASSRIARMPAPCRRWRMHWRVLLRSGMRHVDVDLIARERWSTGEPGPLAQLYGS